jgi:amidase
MRLLRPTFLILALGLAVLARAATFDLSTATVADINAAFNAGALTSEKLTQLYLARIAAYDKAGPKLNAVIFTNEKALEQARALDAERKRSGPRGPLHGIPVLIKDNYDTFDMPTTGGALALVGAVPRHDAFMVKRLRDAGAVLIAKTNLDEMALGGNGESSFGGRTLNPYGLDRVPGGSSAGTGAGLAAVFGALGLGTETFGSVRSPANNNNLVGLVATEGLLSRGGIMPISFTQDRGGPMARSVYDIAVSLSIMAGLDPNDQITRQSLNHLPEQPYESYLKKKDLHGVRVGVLRDLFSTDPTHAEWLKLIESEITRMRDAGAFIVDPVSSGTNLLSLIDRNAMVSTLEYKTAINAYYASREDSLAIKSLDDLIASGKFHPRLKERYASMKDVSALDTNADYLARYRQRDPLRLLLESLMDKYALDVLVYPMRSGPLSPAGTWPLTTAGQNLSDFCGLPAITVPAGFTADGLPTGIEFLGRAWSEVSLLRIAYGYEQSSPHRKLPSVTPALPGESFNY